MVFEEGDQPAADQFGTNVMRVLRQEDTANGTPPATLPNNMRIDSRLEEGYSEEMLSEMRRLKSVWDEASIFYSLATRD